MIFLQSIKSQTIHSLNLGIQSHKQLISLIQQKEDQQATSIKCIRKNNIRQTIMKRNPYKPISNLDLKLLDVKFIAIDDNQLYLTEALQSVRKAKLVELPSLLISKDKLENSFNATSTGDNSILSTGKYMNMSTLDSINQFDQSLFSHKQRQIDFSCVDQTQLSSEEYSLMQKKPDYHNCQAQVQQIRQSIKSRNPLHYQVTKPHSKQKPSFLIKNTQKVQNQDAELEKYRRKIELIKKQNLLIHKQISSLYPNKIYLNKQPLKNIRKIELLKEQEGNGLIKAERKMFKTRQKSSEDVHLDRIWQGQRVQRNSELVNNNNESILLALKKKPSYPMIREKMNFYEKLTEKSPYKDELDKIHKKIISNNLHKNFEQYLLATNKRVPEFIKKLRT